MDRRSRAGPRLPPVTVFVVLAALLLGVAAALLSGTPPTPANVTHSPFGFTPYWELEVFADIVIGLAAVWVVYRLVQRIRDPSGAELLKGPVAVFAVCLLLLLGFVVVVHVFGSTTPAPNGKSGPPSNASGTPPAPGGKPVNGTPPNFTVAGRTFPGWVPYALVIGVAVLAAFVAVPLAYALSGRRRAEGGPAARSPADEARAAIAATLQRLEADPNAEPRELLVALYGRLLTTIDAALVETGTRTAREVEAAIVERWRIPRDAARELTGLFEEARYSLHPIGRGEAERARSALERVLDAIDRKAPR